VEAHLSMANSLHKLTPSILGPIKGVIPLSIALSTAHGSRKANCLRRRVLLGEMVAVSMEGVGWRHWL
jgi:hypothetical protein